MKIIPIILIIFSKGHLEFMITSPLFYSTLETIQKSQHSIVLTQLRLYFLWAMVMELFLMLRVEDTLQVNPCQEHYFN